MADAGDRSSRPGRAFLRPLGRDRVPRLLAASHARADNGEAVGSNTAASSAERRPIAHHRRFLRLDEFCGAVQLEGAFFNALC